MNPFEFLKECGIHVKRYLYTDYWHPGTPIKYEVVFKDTSNKSDKCVMLRHPQEEKTLLKVAYTDCFAYLSGIEGGTSNTEGMELKMKAGNMKDVKELICHLEEITKKSDFFVTRLLFCKEMEKNLCPTM